MLKSTFPFRFVLLTLTLVLTVLSNSLNRTPLVIAAANGGTIPPAWRCGLTSNDLSCSNLSTDTVGHVPSPVLADMNGDSVLDIVVATRNGRVIAIINNGSAAYGTKLFDVDIAPAFGLIANSQKIDSSPAVADIDSDGLPEIVVGAGKAHSNNCYKGGVIVLEHDGSVKPGWPKLASDHDAPPQNCPDPVYSSPSLGDLDNDGDLEIIVGSFDKRIYAWHHDGTPVAGFPPNSKHYPRFGWPILAGRLADTIWSSPTLADLDGDGYLDILIGTDEGSFDDSWGDGGEGWDCPYALPDVIAWAPGYCGGTVYGLDRVGNALPGFHIKTLEIMQSTPAIYDVDFDGDPEIFMGTGSWYFSNSPDHPTDGFRIFGWDHEGHELPGWQGGQVVGGSTPASPTIGDIDGDGDPEVMALAMDQKLYAWHHTGTAVSGFPMTPVDQTGNGYNYDVGRGLVLADYTGNGAMEIFITTGWSITIVTGNGTQLTTTTNPPNADFFFANGSLRNMPAIGDVDGDGELEMVVNNDNLYVWNLSGSGATDWPMFKQNAARTSYEALPLLAATPDTLISLSDINQPSPIQRPLLIQNLGPGTINWTATSSQPSWASVDPASGLVSTETDMATITIRPTGLALGTHQATITINSGGAAGSPQTVDITLIVIPEIYQGYLPYISK